MITLSKMEPKNSKKLKKEHDTIIQMDSSISDLVVIILRVFDNF